MCKLRTLCFPFIVKNLKLLVARGARMVRGAENVPGLKQSTEDTNVLCFAQELINNNQ